MRLPSIQEHQQRQRSPFTRAILKMPSPLRQITQVTLGSAALALLATAGLVLELGAVLVTGGRR